MVMAHATAAAMSIPTPVQDRPGCSRNTDLTVMTHSFKGFAIQMVSELPYAGFSELALFLASPTSPIEAAPTEQYKENENNQNGLHFASPPNFC
jgi:hypothetical protein